MDKTQPNRPAPATLRFSPYAWAKFKYLRDKGSTEVGAFGIGLEDDPLAIIDIIMVKQEASMAHVEFDDEAVANFFEDQVDLGRKPHQFARVWLHTHPGNCASPSGTDENTFTRVFGRCDWAIMAILAKDGDLTARLRYNTGIRAEFQIKVEIDYGLQFGASDHEAWDQEYNNTLNEERSFWSGRSGSSALSYPRSPNFHGHMPGPAPWEDWRDFYEHNRHENSSLLHGRAGSRLTSPRSRGIISADAAEKDEEDPADKLSSDDGGLEYWPLEAELEDKTVEEQAELLDQLDLTPEEVDDYICYYDDHGVLTAEMNPDLAVQYDENEEVQITGFVNEAEDIIMNGFTDTKK